ncbi:sulfurtransferase TusA family protein [Siminovitchia fortis]|uniref:Sulfurtransferase TusA family protein n=1 Tax=Siminovitchia fortis TaxID=254758 RepID=A0A443IKU6_9BACI|nr:sulfurtransferase TusA family protein [Siminovitchia fortis]RWR05420.1 sulfurtransferase TusA family protein [Siminovitchia fortis]
MVQNSLKADVVYDAGPTGCGELIMNLFIKMKKMDKDQVIEVKSYDPGAREDIPAWCRLQGHTLLKRLDQGKNSVYYIRKNK